MCRYDNREVLEYMNARAEEPIKPSGKLRRGFPPDCVARDREAMKYIERVIGLPRLYDIEANTIFRA
jgi:hypothetical protein